MNHKTITPLHTLDEFGDREIEILKDLLTAYNYAGRTYKGKPYALLPDSWVDSGVYPEFNSHSGLVFLTNDDFQALVLTQHGALQFYTTSYSGIEGTAFDLAEEALKFKALENLDRQCELEEIAQALVENINCLNDYVNITDLEYALKHIIKLFAKVKLVEVAQEIVVKRGTEWDEYIGAALSNIEFGDTDIADVILSRLLRDFDVSLGCLPFYDELAQELIEMVGKQCKEIVSK